MAKPLATDDLWAAVLPLLPPEPPKPEGGRPRASDRAALSGILFVLRTGIPWEYVPAEMGVCGMTCGRRLRDWRAAGVWARLHRGLLEHRHGAEKLDWARGHGRIISLVGDSSRVGESGLSIVAAARGGTISLMKSLAREMGRSWITANVVSLGLIETQHSDKAWLDANRDKLTRLYALRRLGLSEDVAPTVVHLASPGASWITGQVISVSGGFSMVG